MRAALVVALVVTAGAWPTAASAERLRPLGHVVVGQASMTTFGDHYHDDLGGDYGGFYAAGGLAIDEDVIPTLHGVAGIHARFDLAFVSPGGVVREDESFAEVPAAPRLLGLLTFEVAGGPAFDLARSRAGDKRLRLRPEVFFGFDRRGVGIGGQLVLWGATLKYRLRSGQTWDGSRVLEEELLIGYVAPSGFEIGIRRTHGNAEDEMGRTDLRALLKGGYSVTGLHLALPLGRR